MFNKIFSQHPTIYKYDRMWIGIILGLTVPTLGIFIVYLLSLLNHFATGEATVTIPIMLRSIKSLAQFTKFMSVGCILNLGVFFLFVNRDYINVARGIILATMLVSIPIIIQSVRNFFI